MVQLGVCGKCQPLPAGGGGESACSKKDGMISDTDCTTKNSCPFDLVCCKTGECAPPNKNDPKLQGENCP